MQLQKFENSNFRTASRLIHSKTNGIGEKTVLLLQGEQASKQTSNIYLLT